MWTLDIFFFFFLREFQTSVLDDNFLSLDEDINRFLMEARIEV